MRNSFNLKKAGLYVVSQYYRESTSNPINPREADSIYLGYLDQITINKYRPDMGDLLYVVEHCSGSDYSGGSAEIANHRWFKEGNIPLENHKGERQIVFYTGGYSTYGVMVNLATLAAGARRELREVIEGIDGYPVIDEQLLSDVELEIEDAAWDSWIDYEFSLAIERLFGEDAELDLDIADTETDWCALHRLLYHLMRDQNEYFEHETGGTVHVRIDRLFEGETVVSLMRYHEFVEACGDALLPYLEKTLVERRENQQELFPVYSVALVGAVVK